MRKLVIVLIAGLLVCPALKATGNYKYAVGISGGYLKLTGGDFFAFEPDYSYGFNLDHRLGDRWHFNVDYTFYRPNNDKLADSVSTVAAINNNAPIEYKTTRLGVTLNRLLFSSRNRLNVKVGLGGGAMFWKMVDLNTNTTFKVPGSKKETTDLATSELFLTAQTGLVFSIVPKWSLNCDFRADYLTGAGAEFCQEVKDILDRWLLGAAVSINFHFGGEGKTPVWKSDSVWSTQPVIKKRPSFELDSDGDGVTDELDKCLNTPRGVVVDDNGCPLDSDGDGIPDGLDDCPDTSPEARGKVDIYGCPVDADFDGLPDFIDRCPHNLIGAVVDSTGCPVDSDADGVPDGLDDCPETMFGVEVDRFGCIDLSIFDKPMVLNINYPSGSFEIDPNSKTKLQKLAGILNFVPHIKMEINGYTDNIGTTAANKNLSEKRANRVRDFLATQGVASDRMKVFGRGEENFVASNDTAEGRAKNRRIEIIFYK
ncbi:MAG: OmpA family protein [candidate division Zixibacteria bacterium]|nr:OmpA family protein [candidate division Zixibacteria bacterium]MDD5425221.1 OmpA family protein [candidate division Zixibacteria bacterium]